MKIAFFSDIHANLPALETVLADIDAQNPDAVYCLGDLVGYATQPNEVVELIKSRRIPTIAGNYDEGIGLANGECGCAYKTDLDKDLGVQSIAYTDSVITPEHRQYLRMLPRHIRLEFQNPNLNLMLVHGSPRKINEYLFDDRPEASLLRIIRDAHTDVLLFGHTHKPYHRVLAYEEAGQTRYCHAINLGSVGKPKDGNPQAGYVLLHLNENTSTTDAQSLQVEFRRVDYDVEKAALAIEASSLPNDFAQMLRTGGK
ncbi:serine/threonine protein phosphatase [Rufibacter radiotolerans]|uniref:Serine/threonine protein phosphatase n=1 Tax=Rufibacter radiotolerans TaxID=1379910 RepID=A0A0H4VN48_9BACT|nr:metallophosphoesterase family protein [Rufibacter radiotolerans]AKQ47340.1 serine/threonine protein phosphatase [Rufibacter radiotolerans]